MFTKVYGFVFSTVSAKHASVWLFRLLREGNHISSWTYLRYLYVSCSCANSFIQPKPVHLVSNTAFVDASTQKHQPHLSLFLNSCLRRLLRREFNYRNQWVGDYNDLPGLEVIKLQAHFYFNNDFFLIHHTLSDRAGTWCQYPQGKWWNDTRQCWVNKIVVNPVVGMCVFTGWHMPLQSSAGVQADEGNNGCWCFKGCHNSWWVFGFNYPKFLLVEL